MKKVMSTRPGLNFVQSIFGCLAALKKPYVYLFWAEFSSSFEDIKIKASSVNKGRSFIGVI